ncbi:MAG: CoA-binding protein [Gammaproteobacteria bacterium]|nr:CoA-binding protein [Gammaproteobacteria bacterium]
MTGENVSFPDAARHAGIAAFPHYFVGINSLAELATTSDRVCVLNILGNESKSVTPTSHVYSAGNVVCGTMPGRSGSVLKTELGDIPVYNSVVEALQAGHRFNVAVVYVPPAGVKDAVIEAVRVNPELTKVIILTEKVPLSDARIIRHYCQQQQVDVFGGNCLGIADAHHHVRIGGALGGSHPEESLIPGSIAIYSNSGNFTTTIAVYLSTAGWGTTVSLSSGKDVYIHFAAAEFSHAFHNDDRSKAAIMYIEPGGYYEQDLVFQKPVVACIVGRWKDRLTKACGHAGAIAGSGDNAAAKEQWFMQKFGVDRIFTADHPVCSARGAVVTNIADIPLAMTAVMALNNEAPDFEKKGDLSMKCWLADDLGDILPAELNIQPVKAVAPYDEQIKLVNEQIGVIFPRQSMKDASGASMMDPVTQITRLFGISILDVATHTYEDNLVMSLVREYPDENSRALANVLLNAYVNLHNTPMLTAAFAARQAGNSPNTALCAALSIIGPDMAARASRGTRLLLELFHQHGLSDPAADESGDNGFDLHAVVKQAIMDKRRELLLTDDGDELATIMLSGIVSRNADTVFIRFLQLLASETRQYVAADAVVAAICCHLAWKPLLHKRLSVTTLYNMPWHFRIFSAALGASAREDRHTDTAFGGIEIATLVKEWSYTDTAYLALLTKKPGVEDRFAFSILLGLVASNGPGTISAQGAKGAVSADGPEVPERVQINKAYAGFLSHTGYAHGGNGYEAMRFLISRFRDIGLADPGDPDHGIDLAELAADYAREYKSYKTQAKAAGNLSYEKIPCINHPVFKGKDVNYDPREVYVHDLFRARNSYNIFHEFYHELVKALASYGVSPNVYCVNIDAVIAVILLKMLWRPFVDREITEQFLEYGAFTTFVYGRLVGEAAEIEDHTTRGRNMDTRTPASKCQAVS